MSTNYGECNCAASKRKIVGDIYTPEIWGPTYWKYLHMFGTRFSKIGNKIILKQTIIHFEELFELLQYIIPCTYCQQHYISYYNANKIQNLKDIPSLEAIQKIKKWLITFHNDIRKNKNKPLFIYTLQEYNDHYANIEIEQCDNDILHGSLKYGLQANFIKLEHYTKFMRIITEMRKNIKV
jgi:hypothetical protein